MVRNRQRTAAIGEGFDHGCKNVLDLGDDEPSQVILGGILGHGDNPGG